MENKQTKKFELVIEIGKEEVEMYLPDNIKESDALSFNEKKALASLVAYDNYYDERDENGMFFISDDKLRKSIEVSANDIPKIKLNLKLLNLIEMVKGEKRQLGKTAKATRYKICYENFYKTLEKINSEKIIELKKRKDNVTQQTTQKHEEETEIPKNLYIEEYTYQKRDTSKIKKHLEFCKEHGLNAYGEATPKKRTTAEGSQWLTNEDMISQICSDDNDDFLPF